MSIDWSAYRITLLLYLGVLLFPLSFYFSYSSFSELQEDTRVINSFTLSSTKILTLQNMNNLEERKKVKEEIENKFEDLKPWIVAHNDEKFYVAAEPLLKTYDSLQKCWSENNTFDTKTSFACYKKAKTILFSLNNMLVLKQNRIYNIFYMNLVIAMAFLFLLIFFTRVYTFKQLSKKAIYDFKSKLYTKEYMLTTLKEISAHMKRTGEPLCVLQIDVKDLKPERKLAQKEQDEILQKLGESLLHTLRDSDIASRYSESEFVLILPNTPKQNIESLRVRLEQHLQDLEYTFNVIEYEKDDTYDSFTQKLI